MFDLFPEVEIGASQAEAIARGLISVAKADGDLHEREGALIAEFYSSVTERVADMSALQKADPVDGEYLAAMLPGADLRRLFLATAILLAYADGNYTGPESKLVGEYGAALGFTEEALNVIEHHVKEYLLSQLTSIRNVDAVTEVAKELKL